MVRHKHSSVVAVLWRILHLENEARLKRQCSRVSRGPSPDDAGQTAVLVLLGGPGHGRGRHVVCPQPGRGGLCGVQLKDRGNKGDSSRGEIDILRLFIGRAQHMDSVLRGKTWIYLFKE